MNGEDVRVEKLDAFPLKKKKKPFPTGIVVDVLPSLVCIADADVILVIPIKLPLV